MHINLSVCLSVYLSIYTYIHTYIKVHLHYVPSHGVANPASQSDTGVGG